MKSFKQLSILLSTMFLAFPIQLSRRWRLFARFLMVLVIADLLVITPAVWAQGSLSLLQAWALGVLGLVTVGLSVYLFVVIFQPERF